MDEVPPGRIKIHTPTPVERFQVEGLLPVGVQVTQQDITSTPRQNIFICPVFTHFSGAQDTTQTVQSWCGRLHALHLWKRCTPRALVSWKEWELLLLDQRWSVHDQNNQEGRSESELLFMFRPSHNSFFFFFSWIKKNPFASYIQVLVRMLPAYYKHVRSYEHTLVAKFFGLHCVKLTGPAQKKVRIKSEPNGFI